MELGTRHKYRYIPDSADDCGMAIQNCFRNCDFIQSSRVVRTNEEAGEALTEDQRLQELLIVDLVGDVEAV